MSRRSHDDRPANVAFIDTARTRRPARTRAPARAAAGADLPQPLASFVGREEEVAALRTLLLDDGARLVTLTGPGGVGKTRLALRVAEALAAETDLRPAFVPLAPIADPALVAQAVAAALGLSAAGDLHGRLAAALRHRRLLLLLDNFEHLVDAAPVVAELLAAAPDLTVVVTSRAPLRVSGEHLFPVAPLPVVGPGVPKEEVADAAATRLFVQRAAAVDRRFRLTEANASQVAAICRRLEGLPLALELAAAKVSLLPLPAILDRLERRLPLLTQGARDHPARLRSLRAAVAWSHDLLLPDEQVLFERLGVFADGFDLEAAEAIAAAGRPVGNEVLAGVEALVAQSLVQARDDLGGPRFRMLETIREFAEERLAAGGEEKEVRACHADHYLALAERAEPELLGPRPEAWLARLATDHANIVAALAWFASAADAQSGARLAGALGEYWYASGRWTEGRTWLDLAIGDLARLPEVVAAKVLVGGGLLAHYQGQADHATPLLERAVQLYRRLGEEGPAAYAQYLLGVAAEDRGDYGRANELLREARGVLGSLGDATNAAYAEAHLGIVALGQGDASQAAAYGQAARDLAADAGCRDAGAVAALVLADAARDRGDLASAAAHYRDHLALAREANRLGLDERPTEGLARAAAAVALLSAARGEQERAAVLLGAAERLREAVGLALAMPELRACEQATIRARGALGDAAFQAAHAAGRAMTLRDVLDELDTALGPAGRTPSEDARAGRAGGAGLSPRELEVLRLIAGGRTNREIAEALYLSARTVERHVTNLYAKIGARGRADATVFALRHGLA